MADVSSSASSSRGPREHVAWRNMTVPIAFRKFRNILKTMFEIVGPSETYILFMQVVLYVFVGGKRLIKSKYVLRF